MRALLSLSFLRGRRTQISAIVIAIATLLLNLNVIDQGQYSATVGFLTAIGLVTASVHEQKTP